MEDKQGNPDEDILYSCTQANRNPVESEFYPMYQEALASPSKMTFLDAKFSLNNIEYKEGQHAEFSYQIEQQYNHYQVVVLKVQLGSFILRLNLINFDRNSPLSQIPSHTQGNFGSIYYLDLYGHNLAVKAFSTKKYGEKRSKMAISRVIEEYSICKICQCLGCGPSMPNYLGFDILVFRDKIEFVMEKCEPVPITKSRYHQLLENLWAMHRFKIIHGDITNANFMFSPVHGKVVFIDFGLSKIIADDCGFKTYTSFRGTPNFVSEPMLNLLGVSQKWDFIDLYYNDLVCLQNIISYKNQKVRVSQTFGEIVEDDDSDSSSNSEAENKEYLLVIQLEYSFFKVLHQAYFDQLSFQASLKAEEGKLIKLHSRRVLRIVQTFLPSPFFQRLLFKDLKELSKLDEYQQCLKSIKNMYVSPLWENFSNSFQHLFEETQQLFEELDSQKRKQLILDYLKSKPKLKEQGKKQKYFSLIFECLRFDTNNFEALAKKELAVCFLESIDIQAKSEGDLAPVAQVIKFLLSFCLSPPLSSWKKGNRFELLTQALFLDAPILEQLRTLEEQVLQGTHYDPEQMISITYEYAMLDKILEVKYKFEDFGYYEQVIRRIKEGEGIALQKAIQQNRSSSLKEGATFAGVLLKLKEGRRVLDAPTIVQPLCSLRGTTTKDNLMKYIFMKEIARAVNGNDYSEFILLLDRAQQQFYRELIPKSIGEQLYWRKQMVQQIVSVLKHKKMLSSKVKQRINCRSIFEKLQLYLVDCWLQGGNDPTVFRSALSDLLTACFQHQRYQLFQSDFEVSLLIFEGNRQLLKESQDLLHQMAQLYLQFLEEQLSQLSVDLKDSSPQASLSQKTQLRSCEGFFYYFLLIIGEPLQQYIPRYEKIVATTYWRYLQLTSVTKRPQQVSRVPQFLYLNMLKYQAFKSFNIKLMLQWERTIMKISDTSIPTFAFKKIFSHQTKMIQVMEKRGEKVEFLSNIIKVLLWGWKYHKFNDRMLAYFEENEQDTFLIARTLNYLWSGSFCCKKQTYQFMKDILKTISSRPLPNMVSDFIFNINIFFGLHKNFFIFDLLRKELGAVDWGSRYKIYCFALSLPSVPVTQRISVIKSIIIHVDSLGWAAKENILNHLFENLLLMISRKELPCHQRKLVSILRFVATHIFVEYKQYQSFKIKQLLKLQRIQKKSGGLRQLLRRKIWRWSKLKDNRAVKKNFTMLR